MHICIVAEGYPTPKDPFMPFVRNLVVELVQQGVQCSVIAPQSFSRILGHSVPRRPTVWKDDIGNGKYIDVYQPLFFTISKVSHSFNDNMFLHAAQRAYKSIKDHVDVLYGHFWHSALVASKLDDSLPVFAACGESEIAIQNRYSKIEIDHFLCRLTGAIYVSTKSYNESVDLGLQKDTPYIIAPNGYDPSRFSKLDKKICRDSLGWPLDKYVVSFVGAFNERKGSKRLSQAIEQNNEIYSCFIGKGNEEPTCSNILFKGSLPNEEIRRYLSASDVFALPTTNEGCCNAIIEAMACGLPVISSNQSFNDDILDDSCSIRIDSMNIFEISDAIQKLSDQEQRRHMSDNALKKATGLTIQERTKNILSFIKRYSGNVNTTTNDSI